MNCSRRGLARRRHAVPGRCADCGEHRRATSQIKTIVLSTRDDQKFLTLEAFRQGAWGCLIKGKSRPHEIIEAVRAVNQGKAILTPRMAGWILDAMTLCS